MVSARLPARTHVRRHENDPAQMALTYSSSVSMLQQRKIIEITLPTPHTRLVHQARLLAVEGIYIPVPAPCAVHNQPRMPARNSREGSVVAFVAGIVARKAVLTPVHLLVFFPQPVVLAVDETLLDAHLLHALGHLIVFNLRQQG